MSPDDLDDDEEDDGLLSPVFQHQLPSIERIHALAEALTEPYAAMALLAAYSGMRWGEVAALRYRDVDPDSRVVQVRWAALETSGGKLYLRRPKNRRRRTTLYPTLIADTITKAWATAKARAEQGGSELMFPSPTGLVLRRSNFGRRHFRPAREAAGWGDQWSFHTLRHCAAVWMLYDQGFALHDVADVLGHRDVSVTQRVYVQAREGVAERLAVQAG